MTERIDADVRRRTTRKLDAWFGRPDHRQPLRPVD